MVLIPFNPHKIPKWSSMNYGSVISSLNGLKGYSYYNITDDFNNAYKICSNTYLQNASKHSHIFMNIITSLKTRNISKRNINIIGRLIRD